MGRDSAGAGAGINMIFQYHAETDSCMNISNLKKGGIMERIEYLTEILPENAEKAKDEFRKTYAQASPDVQVKLKEMWDAAGLTSEK